MVRFFKTFSILCAHILTYGYIASIFKRMSDAPDLDFNASQDFTAAYKVCAFKESPPAVVAAHR
jgi:hypothetical protein